MITELDYICTSNTTIIIVQKNTPTTGCLLKVEYTNNFIVILSNLNSHIGKTICSLT